MPNRRTSAGAAAYPEGGATAAVPLLSGTTPAGGGGGAAGAQCVYVLTRGNHLDTQQDKFSHPPEDRERFDAPQVRAAPQVQTPSRVSRG